MMDRPDLYDLSDIVIPMDRPAGWAEVDMKKVSKTQHKSKVEPEVRKTTETAYYRLDAMFEAGVPWTLVLKQLERYRKRWEQEAIERERVALLDGELGRVTVRNVRGWERFP